MRGLIFLKVSLAALVLGLVLVNSSVFATDSTGGRQGAGLINFPPYNPTPSSDVPALQQADQGNWNATAHLDYTLGGLIDGLGRKVLGYPAGTNGQAMGGAVGVFAWGIEAMVKTRPASGGDYLAYMANRLRVPFTPSAAYAASGGLGYTSLAPVLPLWTIMRNLAYFIFAIIFIVAGIMIITRQKIDAKTAVTLENALPKIVIALVLVTFSYAIAGFFIDIMYVALALIVVILGSTVSGSGHSLTELLSKSIFDFAVNGGLWTAASEVAATVGFIVDSLINFGAVGPNQSGVGQLVGSAFGFVSSGLAFLIVAVAILWALFQTWLKLISAYANILIAIIFSPLLLMLDAIPGQNQFSGWFRTIMANLMAFPTVVVMLTIGVAIIQNLSKGAGQDTTTGFVPPLLGAGTQGAMTSFVGMGILLTIPKAVEMVQQALKAPEQKWGTAWSQNISAARAGLTAAGSYVAGETYFKGREKEKRLKEQRQQARYTEMARAGTLPPN